MNPLEADGIGPLCHYLKTGTPVELKAHGVAATPIARLTPGMQANARFFSHPQWGPKYFDCENHRHLIGERWRAATGNWQDKVVVDMGCGPGNLFRAVDGVPKILIGVDISVKALAHARALGYTPLLADAQDTPLMSGIADLVTANATLHHVDDMAAMLAECARLVKPGGLLVTDEDPLQCHHVLSGMGQLATRLRSWIPVTRVRRHPHRSWQYVSFREQRWREKTEIHHQFMGDGVSRDLFFEVLEPLGFSVKLYPHGHIAGPEIFEGAQGRNSALLRATQRVSGLDPAQTDLLLSVMCVAVRDRV